jgi:hypothetical protein
MTGYKRYDRLRDALAATAPKAAGWAKAVRGLERRRVPDRILDNPVLASCG